MTAKHTPGPWLVEDDNGLFDVVATAEGYEGMRIASISTDASTLAAGADARLIAAAPEMLEELQLQAIALRQEIAATDPRQCMRLTSLQIRLDRLEGVIAKAEGR